MRRYLVSRSRDPGSGSSPYDRALERRSLAEGPRNRVFDAGRRLDRRLHVAAGEILLEEPRDELVAVSLRRRVRHSVKHESKRFEHGRLSGPATADDAVQTLAKDELDPLEEAAEKSLRIPLYYAGVQDHVSVSREGGEPREYTLDRSRQIELPVKMTPQSVTWFVVKNGGQKAEPK